jgi:hypothetical protein
VELNERYLTIFTQSELHELLRVCLVIVIDALSYADSRMLIHKAEFATLRSELQLLEKVQR